ncbi:hypothetical protein KUCAC02_019406 [Chaenocephalus aceratus]|uniref:Uncharacterized protein n=1 Tax=Chaenocephalus aceratus TaxID=36190 RepID=A0ACB9VQ14_CHAAC|nr:hypothetical protein KUCAC02_019406 [Chaenocephalus aceratus]
MRHAICTHCERLSKKDLGVRIPRPLGNGPSRFIPEKRFWKRQLGHQCSYLVNLHVNDFLQVGGDPKWLNGLDEAPQKLQQLGELNKILAHRPWLSPRNTLSAF